MYIIDEFVNSLKSIDDLGHTKDHMNLTDDEIKFRVSCKDPAFWTPRSTGFNTGIDVLAVVKKVLKRNEDNQAFLEFLTFEENGVFKVWLDFKSPAGRGFFLNTNWKEGARDCNRVSVIVKTVNGDPYVVTAFPELSAAQELQYQKDKKDYFAKRRR